MYKKCVRHSEQSECVASLAERAINLHRSLGFSDQDARAVTLNNIRSIAYACQMTMNLLDSWTIGDEMVRSFVPQVLGMQDVNKRSVKSAGDILHKVSKLSLALLGQFQVENCLRILVRELRIQTSQQGFYLTAKSLVNHLHLQSEYLDIFNTVAMIRNSLHSNGIHHGYCGADTVVTIGGVIFEFLHEQRVQCATVEHIAHALEASVEGLQKVFTNPTVAALPDPIMEQYVWEIATAPNGE